MHRSENGNRNGKGIRSKNPSPKPAPPTGMRLDVIVATLSPSPVGGRRSSGALEGETAVWDLVGSHYGKHIYVHNG